MAILGGIFLHQTHYITEEKTPSVVKTLQVPATAVLPPNEEEFISVMNKEQAQWMSVRTDNMLGSSAAMFENFPRVGWI